MAKGLLMVNFDPTYIGFCSIDLASGRRAAVTWKYCSKAEIGKLLSQLEIDRPAPMTGLSECIIRIQVDLPSELLESLGLGSSTASTKTKILRVN